MIFYDLHHPSTVIKEIQSLMMSNPDIFVDVLIKVEDREIPCNRLILSANSGYFKAMFSNSFTESSDHVISIEDVSYDVMSALVAYCTTSKIDVNQDNVYDLLTAANRFEFTHIEEACAEELSGMITIENHLEIWCFADGRRISKLLKDSEVFMQHHFLKIIAQHVWLEYPLHMVKSMLDADNLNVFSESQVYEAVIEWVQHDPMKRRRHLPELFSSLRLQHLSTKYLLHIVSEQCLVTDDEYCAGLVKRVKDTAALPAVFNTEPHIPARESSYSSALFVMGGLSSSRDAISKVERFSLGKMVWENICELPEPLWGAAATRVEGLILLSGGEGICTRDTLMYCDPAKIDDGPDYPWEEGSRMGLARFGHGMAECMGWAFVVGGYNEEALASCEMYDMYTDKWYPISPLNFARDGPGVVAMENSVYACGGYCGKDYKVVERYDPRVGSWERIPNMEQARSYAAIATADNKLYAIGGRQKDKKIAWSECYDPRASKWLSLEPLQYKRSDARATTIGKILYLLGGLDDHDEPVHCVESYDPSYSEGGVVGEWMELQPLTSRRRLMAVASVGN